MHRISTWVVLLGLVGWTGSRADAADPMAIIDKAIQAVGGADKIAANRVVAYSTKGTYHGVGDAIPFTADHSVQGPDKQRTDIEGFYSTILNGDKGWVVMAGEARAMEANELAYNQRERYVGQVRSLTPLKDKAFTLSPMDEIKVDNRPAVGIKVTRAGHVDVSLYFDKETGFLVKSRHETWSPEQGYTEVEQETYLRQFKEFEGFRLPTKVTSYRAGQVYIDAEVTEFEALDRFDDAVFDPA